jgi:hypothetical protein
MSLQPLLDKYWEENTPRWLELAGKLGALAKIPAPEEFENSYIGLDAYLQTSGGITHFPARELVKADYPWPPQCTWPAALVGGLLGERFRVFNGGESLPLRHWYRSVSFNVQRKGAPFSDHLWACGWDYDFNRIWALGVLARRKAQRWLTKESGIPLNMISLGVGWRTLHVGFFAPRTLAGGKHRRWKYGSITKTEQWLS